MRALYKRLSQIMIVSILINALNVLVKLLVEKKPDAPKWFKALASIGIIVIAFVLTTALPVLIIAFIVDVIVYGKNRISKTPDCATPASRAVLPVLARDILSVQQLIALSKCALANNGPFSISIRIENGAYHILSASEHFVLGDTGASEIKAILDSTRAPPINGTVDVFVPLPLAAESTDELIGRFRVTVIA